MSIELSSHPIDLCVRALASGSSGNCFLVQRDRDILLIDCGLPIKVLQQLLLQRNVDPRTISAILLTHEHSDHIRSLNFFSTRFDIPVVGNPATLAAATDAVGPVRERPLATGSALTLGNFEVAAFPVAHDAAETVGFLIEIGGQRICYLTDTGHFPETCREPLQLANLIVLEANHDEARVRRSNYPESLKQRILSPLGHLSNAAAARALAENLDPARQTVWLAHLSARTNSPRLALMTVRGHLERTGVRGAKIQVAERDQPSLIWHSADAGFQPRLLF